MQKSFRTIFWLAGLMFCLNSCTLYENKSLTAEQYARCKELKTRIVMTGTPISDNDTGSQMQRAELANLNRTYNDECP